MSALFTLAFLKDNWKWLVGLALVLSLAGYIGFKEIQLSNVRADALRWQHNAEVYRGVAEANAQALKDQAEIQKKMQTAIVASNKHSEDLKRLADKLTQEILRVQGPNPPVGPRTKLVLDCLRERTSGTISGACS